MSPMEVSTFTQGQIVNQKYRILSELARGETGPVYTAVEVRTGRRCTLKLLEGEAVGQAELLKQELDKILQLRHPNIASIGDIEETDEHQPFLVSEFVEGVRLDEMIRRQAPLPLPRACGIARQIAWALETAHHAGIVHGDLKPSKVILTPGDDAEKAMVLGFGAFVLKSEHFVNMARLALGRSDTWGEAEYISPEQAVGTNLDALDGRSDVYSLGVILYQMLTGEAPFRGTTPMEILLSHIFSAPAPFDHRGGVEIPEALETLVMRMLAKNRQDRPASATALVDQLSAWEKHTLGAAAREEAIAEPEPQAAASVSSPTTGDEETTALKGTPVGEQASAGEEAATTAGTFSSVDGSPAISTFGRPGDSRPPAFRGGEAGAPAANFGRADESVVSTSPAASGGEGAAATEAGPQHEFVAGLKPQTPPEPAQAETRPLDVVLEHRAESEAAGSPFVDQLRGAPELVISRGHLPPLGATPKPAKSHVRAAAVIIILVLIGAGGGWLYYSGRTYWFNPEFVKGRVSSLRASREAPSPPRKSSVPSAPQTASSTPSTTARQSAPLPVAPPARLPVTPPVNQSTAPLMTQSAPPGTQNSLPGLQGTGAKPPASQSGTTAVNSQPITPGSAKTSPGTNVSGPTENTGRLGQIQHARAIRRRASKRVANNALAVAEVIKRGDYYFDRGEYNTAIRVYERGLVHDPGNSRLMASIARARRAKAAEAEFLGQ